jgi:Uncharacterised nucleotidyltransferase
MSTAIPVPSFGRVETALRGTTEYLAHELARPGARAPQWSEFEWCIARAVAALQGISALLSATLQWTGPEHWQTFLAEQKAQTLLRERSIAELLSQIDMQARRAGLGLVALKGAALLPYDLYPTGTRPMGDVDLLGRPCDVDAVARVLAALGYVESFETWRHKVFVPCAEQGTVSFGEHISNPVKIELHTRIAERLPILETDITTLESPRHLHAGLNAYPSRAALMRHLLLHAAGNTRARALRHIQLHDVALLAQRMSSSDWQQLIEPGAREHAPWWAFPPLVLTAHYYPGVVPAAVLAATERGCSRLLRRVSRRQRLCDVSWSKIRIPAFPGIEWSRSLREAGAFAKSRIWPSRQELLDLRRATTVQPALASIPWYDLSHGARILRWIFSHPPRVQTMHSVRTALGHRP